VLGKKLSDLLPATASESLLAHDQEVLARKEAIEQQHIIPHHDDQLHTYLKISFPLYDTQGNVMAVGSIGQDITLLKLAEEENAYLQDQVIVAQYVALREATSPLCPLTDRMVFMPLIGAIDSERVQHITDTLLNGIAHQRANIAILDITGVTVMDEQVASALIGMARAVKLLGARVILTGIGPLMAQTLVGLDADLSDVVTCSTLQSGLTYAVREYGVHFA
jgi:anti-anti-sigma regulatory factor